MKTRFFKKGKRLEQKLENRKDECPKSIGKGM